MWIRRALGMMVLGSAAVAVGCGGGGTTTPAPAAPPPNATENQINPMGRDRVQDGGKMTWALDLMPSNFNYNQIDGTLMDNHDVVGSLLPSPFKADASGTPHWNPDYLASEPTLVTDPTQVVTYALNPKAAWSDGTPITWQDLYWQWRATRGKDKAYQISGSQGYEDIENVARGRTDREAVVTFSKKFGDWRSLFDPLYPASTNKDPKVFNEGWKTPLVSAGPFKLASVDKTSQTITVVRDGTWWGNPAKLDSIVYRVIDHNAQIDSLANGEIDFVDMGSDANTNARARTMPNVEIRTAGGPNFTHITLNGSGPFLQDVRVRRAVAMGIDRATIARALLTPLGVEASLLNNHIFMRNQKGYQDNAGEVGTFDAGKAAEILDETGWTLKAGVRAKDGKTLALNLVIPTAITTSRQISELIQNMLGKIGVTVNIVAVPVNDFFDKYVRPGQFDLTLFSWIGTLYPVSSSKSIYVKPTRDSKGQLDVQQNYARVGSDDIDRLYSEATQELDPARAIELANRIDAAIWAEVHSLTVYQRPERIAVRKGLANYGAKGFADVVYQDVGWAKP